MAGRNNWTDEETILVFYYYCQIPFGKIHKTNPLIIKIAEMIGRSPSAVVFKMGNLGHFDPSLQARNVKGLSIIYARGIDKNITVDGDFGPATKTAVIALQKKLFPSEPNEWDGIVGRKTWEAVLTALK